MIYVFDTEPILAWLAGEPGQDAVADLLDEVATEEAAGAMSMVNVTETRYLARRAWGEDAPDQIESAIGRVFGVSLRDVGQDYRRAAVFKAEYGMALGDSFAAACADSLARENPDDDVQLVVGGDDDYDDVTEVDIERFRDHGV